MRHIRGRLALIALLLSSAAPAQGQTSTVYVSDINWASAASGWGPVERDASNGELSAGDGHPLTIGGVSFVKGLGVHAYSDIRYQLFATCTALAAVVGLDDEVGANGSVTFAVYGNGTLIYYSGVLTGSSPGAAVSVPLHGINELALIVTDAGDGPAFDHADWADLRLTCSGSPGSQLAPPVSLPAGINPHSVAAVDLNGDGRLDLAAANAGSNAASVWLGNGDSTFGGRTDFATGPTPKTLAVGDLNKDGKPDLVSPNQDGASVSVLLATGNGSFGPAVDYPACVGTHDVAIGDFNRDSLPDLLVACWGGTVVSYLRGNGNGTFAAMVNYQVGSAPVSLVAADFNGDGSLDAAVANNASANLSVLIGNGNGSFNPHVPYPVGMGPHSVRAADIDRDGLIDLVAANEHSNTISVLRGRGGGTFTPAVHYATGAVPKGVAIADINGDGLPDLLSANTAGNYPTCCNPGGDTISLLLNAGGGSFAAAQTYLTGTTPFAVATGDFDRDGDLDVATANWHSNDVTILRNDASPEVYLSDLSWASTISGWGPVERDRSNGELGASDGHTITLNGATFAKGLGVHSNSEIIYDIPTGCTQFLAAVGIDDEVGSLGGVQFQVWADSTLLFVSTLLTGGSASVPVAVTLAGHSQLRLVVLDGGDGLAFDHADWAGARFRCASGGPGTSYLSDLSWSPTTNGWGPVERDRSNGELGATDGQAITLNGTTFAKGLGVHALSEVRIPLNGTCSWFLATIGIDDEVGSLGSVVFRVLVDGVQRYDSGVTTGTTPSKTVVVPITGASVLTLLATDAGNGNAYDHADWAGARVVCQ